MQIEKVKIYPVFLPFALHFSHSLRKRSSVTNVIVEIIADHGDIRGYGEGAPRSYVTGETPDVVAKNIRRFLRQDKFPWTLNHVSQIWDFVDRLSGNKLFNSAICAVETALLDALGKSQNRSIIEYFRQDYRAHTIHYGAALPLADTQTIRELCRRIKKMKINKLKLKMGKDYVQNKDIIDAVRQVFEDNYDVKADINGAWDYTQAVRHLSLINNYKINVVEQPMMPDDPGIAEFARLIQASNAILMADESVCSFSDAALMVKTGHYKMVNIRLSKCGGFRNSFKIIDYLRRNGISFQIGCHLGESGILSAAGRVLCLLCGDAVYYDGSYDKFLLKENVTANDISFGPGGRAGPLDGPGLGVIINHESLARLSENGTPITILPDTA